MTDTTLVLAATYLDTPLQAGVVFDSMLEDGMHDGWRGWSESSRQVVEEYGPKAGGPLWRYVAKTSYVYG